MGLVENVVSSNIRGRPKSVGDVRGFSIVCGANSLLVFGQEIKNSNA